MRCGACMCFFLNGERKLCGCHKTPSTCGDKLEFHAVDVWKSD